jgi:polyisoprenoid-binding protein YceI
MGRRCTIRVRKRVHNGIGAGILVWLAIAGLLSAWASTRETFSIDPRRVAASFEVHHLGIFRHRGRFSSGTGRVEIDRDGSGGSIDITLETSGLTAESEEMEKMLRGEDFLDVERHPRLRYQSSRLRFDADRIMTAEGELTMLGVTRPLVLSVRQFRCDASTGVRKVCEAAAVGSLRRSEYGMNKYLPWVSDRVRLEINLAVVQE